MKRGGCGPEANAYDFCLLRNGQHAGETGQRAQWRQLDRWTNTMANCWMAVSLLSAVAAASLASRDAGLDVRIPSDATRTLTELVAATRPLSMLAFALKASGLSEELNQREGPFTLFAPADAAFAKVGSKRIFSFHYPLMAIIIIFSPRSRFRGANWRRFCETRKI